MLILYIFYLAIKNTNPIKIRVTLVLIGALMFYYIKILTRQSWFPMIFYILFIGGILIIFIIVSSMLPNEPIKKNNYRKIIGILIVILIIGSTKNITITQELWSNVKNELLTNLNFIILTNMLIRYFVTFLILVSKEKIPLRTFC